MKLEIGSNDYFEVRHEKLTAAIAGSFSVLYLSDLHFNRHSASITSKIISRINELDPDIILLGGDYVDFKEHLVHLDTLLKALSQRENVFAIAGNHDYRFGVATIQKIMAANNIGWIENGSAGIKVNNTLIRIDGGKPPAQKTAADFAILCLHGPTDINRFKTKYDIAFAGHLHGCQLVLWQNDKGLYPGKFVFKWNVLKKEVTGCQFYISKGLGQTLPVRLNCAKDMILVEVVGEKLA